MASRLSRSVLRLAITMVRSEFSNSKRLNRETKTGHFVQRCIQRFASLEWQSIAYKETRKLASE